MRETKSRFLFLVPSETSLSLSDGALTRNFAPKGVTPDQPEGYGIAELRFSRGVEGEADREGMAMMLRAKLDARKMVDALGMLQQSEADVPTTLQLFSDHPRIEDRDPRSWRACSPRRPNQ
jgi:predicted Zn-dependent protease